MWIRELVLTPMSVTLVTGDVVRSASTRRMDLILVLVIMVTPWILTTELVLMLMNVRLTMEAALILVRTIRGRSSVHVIVVIN